MAMMTTITHGVDFAFDGPTNKKLVGIDWADQGIGEIWDAKLRVERLVAKWHRVSNPMKRARLSKMIDNARAKLLAVTLTYS